MSRQNESFTVIMEGPIDNGDGNKKNQIQRLECIYTLINKEDKTHVSINKVNDIKKGPINDEEDLPQLDDVLDAIRLDNWARHHKAVFTDCRVVNKGIQEDQPATD